MTTQTTGTVDLDGVQHVLDLPRLDRWTVVDPQTVDGVVVHAEIDASPISLAGWSTCKDSGGSVEAAADVGVQAAFGPHPSL